MVLSQIKNKSMTKRRVGLSVNVRCYAHAADATGTGWSGGGVGGRVESMRLPTAGLAAIRFPLVSPALVPPPIYLPPSSTLLTRPFLHPNAQGAPAREGAKLFSSVERGTAVEVGVVTSGTFAPCLKAPIAMGYVTPALVAAGSTLAVEVRGKLQPTTVVKMPFVPHSYYKAAA